MLVPPQLKAKGEGQGNAYRIGTEKDFDFRRIIMKLVKIILAIILPPVAAFMQVGVSMHFWLNILLCLWPGIPGMIHALWLVATDKS